MPTHSDRTRLIAPATARGRGRRPVSPPVERASTMLSDNADAMRDAAPGPVLLLQGDQDPQTPVQTIRELMGDYPTLQVEFLPQTGQLLFFKVWPLVLDRLGALLAR